MNELNLWNDNNFSYSDFIYTFPNGSYIELFGLEDEGKARGPGRDILFINEANLLKKILYDQLAMRTKGAIFLDWNPADFVSWVYAIADDKKNKLIHSTYKNNLANLSAQQIGYIEGYKDLPDDFMWKVYGLGQRGAAKELIYTQWKIVNDLPGKGDVFYGLDFGYNHPAAFVKVEYYEGCNYVQELIYQSGLTLTELLAKIKTFDIGRGVIYADAAEPKSIEEIYRAGINIHAANKDVWAGIVKVKSFPLYVTAGSVNLQNELQSYKWKKDKEDKVIDEPVKANDDGCDALRYAIYNYHDKPKFSPIVG
jgi:phage terminase large subunit